MLWGKVSKELLDSIKRHEGWRDNAYQDSVGVWTVGYGRNLQELKIDKALGEKWLVQDIRTAVKYAQRFPEYKFLDTPARKDVFIEMVFNMGPSRLAGFKNMLAAIRDQDWLYASLEGTDSKWARQVGIRAVRLMDMLNTGEY